MSDAIQIVGGTLQGILSSTVFILVLFMGFCIIVGFTKTKRTAGNVAVIKSLDETISHQPMVYLTPTAPRGPADQLHSPELMEAAAAGRDRSAALSPPAAVIAPIGVAAACDAAALRHPRPSPATDPLHP